MIFDVLLVVVDDTCDDQVHGIYAYVRVLDNLIERILQVHLLERQLLDSRTILRAFHLVFIAHRRISCLDADCFRGVNGKVDGLVGDSQSIEFWGDGVHRILFESK